MIKIRKLFNMIIKSVGLVDTPAIAEEFSEVKRAVPFDSHPLLPRDSEWDAEMAIARIKVWAGASSNENLEGLDWNKYREAFAWYDERVPDNLGSYKLPHHDVQAGVLYTHFRGTVAAKAAIAGARGGIEIPESDRPQVEEHLDQHLEEFEGDEESAREKNTEESMNEEMKKAVLALIEPIQKSLGELAETVGTFEKRLGESKSAEAVEEVKSAVEGAKKEAEEVKSSLETLKKEVDENVEDTCKRFEQAESAIEKLGRGGSKKIAGQDEDVEGKEKKSKFPSVAAHLNRS